jgi:hypothetical protein
MCSVNPNVRRVTIHQPDFLPWLGFFHRIALSDVYIVLDDVQFLRRGWHHRDKILTRSGPIWLTVPIKKGGREILIRDVVIDYSSNWRKKHLNSFYLNYSKAPAFEQYFSAIELLYSDKNDLLYDFNLKFIRFFLDVWNVNAEIVMSSSYGVREARNDRLVALVKAVKGSEYVTGMGSKDYLDESLFTKNHIDLRWECSTLAPYKQLSTGFSPALSAIDYIFNMGDQVPWDIQ